MEQKFDLKNNPLLKIFHRIPQHKQKYFTTNNFHMKISNSELFANYSR